MQSPRIPLIAYLAALFAVPIAVLFAAPIAAQPAHMTFERLGITDGMPSNCAQTILQDRKGFLWIGTCVGLARYDGYTFRTFAADPANPEALVSNDVLELYEDRAGRFWVGTNKGGIQRFDRETEAFRRYGPEEMIGVQIGEDALGTLWAVMTKDRSPTLFRYDAVSDRFEPYPHPFENSTSYWIDERGRVWARTGSDAFTMDPSTRRFIRRTSIGRPREWNVHNLVADVDESVVWAAFADRIERIDLESGERRRFPIGPPGIAPGVVRSNRMIRSRDGRIWTATTDGIVILDPSTGAVSRARHDPADPFSLPCDHVLTLHEDRSGNVWAGTLNCGLAKTSPQQEVRHYSHRPGGTNTLANPHVTGLFELEDGTTLVAMRDGSMQKLDLAKGEVRPFPLIGSVVETAPNVAVKDMLETHDGALWLATWGGGVIRVDASRRRAEAFTPGSGSVASPNNRVLLEDHREGARGDVWIGSEHGLTRYDPDTGTFDTWRQEPGGLSSSTVWSMHFDRDGTLWIGTYGGGLNRFDPATGKAVRFRHDPENPQTIGSDNISAIVESADGDLWLGTYGGGLSRLKPESGAVRRYTADDGLPDNVVADVLRDGRGFIWLSTDKGIARVDPATHAIRSFHPPDGMEVFSVGAALRKSDGTLLFGGNNGLVAFHPDSLSRYGRPPPIALTDFKIFDRSVSPGRRPGAGDTLRLDHEENFISFEFAALDFTAPERNQYAYKLVGFDHDWIHSGNRRYAAYTNLDPGHYELRVRAASSDGVWNEEGLTIPLAVVPPFWMTWWFRIGAGVMIFGAAGGLIFYVARQRLRREMEELRLQHRLQIERERISNDLHDSVGAQLSNIVADVDLIRIATKEGTANLSEYLDLLSDDARGSLSQLRDTVWALHHDAVSVEELCRRIEHFGKRMSRRSGTTRVECGAEGGDCIGTLTPEQTLHLFRIAQEAIHNAVKHAEARRIGVRIHCSKGEIELIVSNDGAFRRSEDSQGIGLSSMRRRAEALNGSFDIDGGPDGTQIRVCVPA